MNIAPDKVDEWLDTAIRIVMGVGIMLFGMFQ